MDSESFYQTQLISGLIDLGAVVFILAYMFFKSIPLTLITILIFAINTIFMLLTRPAVAQAIDDEVAEQSKSSSHSNRVYFFYRSH